MAAVYKAVLRDDAFSKIVAIKILPFGLNSVSRVQRFRRERQILGSLEHPNISRLLDVGSTEDGLPYLVMEYVDGVTLDRYLADDSLTMPDRLKLFLQICDAVQIAHRNLIVHCDLKPSNVLVTREGVPKLLDFGIAKLLDDEGTSATRLLTPKYASPEQVLGNAVTTATDVYALGMLLYQMLTGREPYQAATPSEYARAACEQELDVRSLPRDLGGVVSKATQKNALRRYRSADDLAADVQRYLGNRPVTARPVTFFYRAAKYTRRNAIAVGLTIACSAALAFGVATRIIDSRAADRRIEELRLLAGVIVFDTFDELSRMPKSVKLQRTLITKSIQYLDSAVKEQPRNVNLVTQAVESYIRLGQAQCFPGSPNLGDTGGALSSFNKAKEFAERLVGFHPTARSRGELCLALEGLSPVLLRAGRTEEAIATADRYLKLAIDLRAARPDSIGHRIREQAARTHLAAAIQARGVQNHSVADLRRAGELLEIVISDMQTGNNFPQGLREMALENVLSPALQAAGSTLNHLGDWTGDPQHYSAALRMQESGVEIMRERSPSESSSYLMQNLSQVLAEMAYSQAEFGRRGAAEKALSEAQSLAKAETASDPDDLEAAIR